MDSLEVADSTVSAQTLEAPLRGSFNLRGFSRDAALVMGAAVVANVFSYAFHFVLSRKLGPDAYGTLVTLMTIAAMLGVLGASVGTVAMQETAKMWSAGHDASIAPFLRRTGALVLGLACILAVGLFVASIPLRSYLHITAQLLWLLLALFIVLGFFSGFVRGAAQGAHRFGIFATSLVGEGLAKLVVALGLVALGLGVAGTLGGVAAGSAIGIAVIVATMMFGGAQRAWTRGEHLHLGGAALKVLAVTSATSALFYVDMLFAKHHFTGTASGFFGAAGTVARTIPYGTGLVALILMPKAAAAIHSSRESVARLLALAAGIAVAVICGALLVICLFPNRLIGLTYGPLFAGAAGILRLYAANEALFALWAIAVSYLIAVARYEVFGYLLAGAVLEAVAMAAFGSTPVRLLSIAIVANALLVPIVWALALRTLRTAAQASGPPRAETPA